MENNEYFFIQVKEETKEELILLGFNELPYCVYNDEHPDYFIINKTKNQFWSNGCKALAHAKKMTNINPITLNEIKQWETN